MAFIKSLLKISFFGWLLLPFEAHADWKWDAIQITCDKDLDYFALKTLALEDVKPKDEPSAKRIEQQSGIYDINSLLKHPYICSLPGYIIENVKAFPMRTITAKIENYREATGNGICSNALTFSVSIFLNNKRVYSQLVNQCYSSETHQIELDIFNILTDCTLSENKLDSRVCTTKSLQINVKD